MSVESHVWQSDQNHCNILVGQWPPVSGVLVGLSLAIGC